MSSSETRVTFGTLPDPLRHFAPHHRNTRPVRSIMRRPKAFARNPAGQAHAFSNNISLDISNTVHSSYRPSSVMRASSPATHMHYVGSRKRGHSSVFSVSSAPRSPSRHKRHSSAGSSTSSRSHRHATSETASSFHGFGHKRGHSNLAHTFRSVFSPGLRRYSSTAVSSPRKLGHRKGSSADSSFVYVQSPSQEIDIPPGRHSGHNRAGSYDSATQGLLPSFQNSVSPFDLRSLGYALPSTPYPFHTTPSPPHNSYTESFCLPESDPWLQPFSYATHPPSERVHLHTELLAGTGHTLRWNMMLPPQTAVSGFDDPSLHMIIYSGLPAVDSSSQDFLQAPACPGAAQIIVRAGNNSALSLWMDQWGPIEIYPSSTQNEITIFEVLQVLYAYFQTRLSSQETIELPVESRQRIAHARAARVVSEGQGMDSNAEWDLPPKRVDVLALWSVFGGFEVKYNYGHAYPKLDEPGWRVVELDLKLRNTK